MTNDLIKEHKLENIQIEEISPNRIPPWLLGQPDISIDILNATNKKENPTAAKAIALSIIDDKYKNIPQYYTDGSKNPDNNRVGLGIYSAENNLAISVRLTDNCSVYTSELIAIGIALRIIDQEKPEQGAVILTDSLSSLQ